VSLRAVPASPVRAAEPLLAGAARRIGLEAARGIRVGCLTIVLPDGSRRIRGDRSSDRQAEIRFHTEAALAHLLLNGEMGAGEAYVEGGWSTPDLVGLIELAALNREALRLSSGWWRVPGRVGRTVGHRLRRNTLGGARRNIAAHYDLSNDLFGLFLDETMTYSSAVYASDDQSLAEAQRNKYRVMAANAGIRGGEHVLEIGSGWGGFAMFAAGELGCRVTTVTISEAQAGLARERIAAAGLADRVDVQLCDYREIRGTYDAVVSIEMLEAVGAEYFGTYFRAVDRALVPGGRASIQTIAFPHDAYEGQLRGVNWIQRYIFPGGVLPSLASIEASLAGTRLLVRGVTDIAPHYVRTLRTWRHRFLSQRDRVRALGFDDRFIRTWEYYLAISEVGFRLGLAQDFQLVLEKSRGLELPS
jgi:cyclopropane-fatty-acyl-phospholipid synthase